MDEKYLVFYRFKKEFITKLVFIIVKITMISNLEKWADSLHSAPSIRILFAFTFAFSLIRTVCIRGFKHNHQTQHTNMQKPEN